MAVGEAVRVVRLVFDIGDRRLAKRRQLFMSALSLMVNDLPNLQDLSKIYCLMLW